MRKRKLRMTCESALRVAEWRLAEERRRFPAADRYCPPRPQLRPPVTARPSLAKLYALWISIGLVVLAAIFLPSIFVAVVRGEVLLPFLLASLVALCAGVAHAYTFEVGVWCGLREDAFAATPFGPPSVTKALQRTVWHFHTVSWLATSVALACFTFRFEEPYAGEVVWMLIVYWLAIVVASFVVPAFSLGPTDSYFAVMAGAFQWAIVFVMVGLMYWGIAALQAAGRSMR